MWLPIPPWTSLPFPPTSSLFSFFTGSVTQPWNIHAGSEKWMQLPKAEEVEKGEKLVVLIDILSWWKWQRALSQALLQETRMTWQLAASAVHRLVQCLYVCAHWGVCVCVFLHVDWVCLPCFHVQLMVLSYQTPDVVYSKKEETKTYILIFIHCIIKNKRRVHKDFAFLHF